MLESPLRRAVKIYIGVRFLEDHSNSDKYHAKADYTLSHEATSDFILDPRQKEEKYWTDVYN
jgi:hypothetical protein